MACRFVSDLKFELNFRQNIAKGRVILMRKKIAVVGDKGSVLGFKSVGFDVHMAASLAEIRAVMSSLVRGDYGIIFITEQAYVQIPDIIADYKEKLIPAIIPIPGKDGSLGIGIKNVKKNVERAVGADILFNDD